MFSEPTGGSRLLFQLLAGALLLAGTAADLWLGVRYQTRAAKPGLPALPDLARLPFTSFHAAVVLGSALLFALPLALHAPAAAAPDDRALLLGPLLYTGLSALVVGIGLLQARLSFRQAFRARPCPGSEALGKGLLYGLALLPPATLLSLAVTAALEAMGYAPEPQEVFDWLADSRLCIGTRLFMMAAAVILAPVAEEALYRGLLFPALLKRRAFLPAALLCGTFFALVHVHAPSFLPLLFLSVAFSAGYAATGSLLTPIAMHALFNLTSLLVYLGESA